MLAIVDWTLFAAINALLWYAADCAACHFLGRAQTFSLRLVAAGLFYCAQITVTVLLLGVVFQYLNALALFTTSILLAALLIYRYRAARHPWLAPLRSGVQGLFAARDYSLYFMALLFILQAALLLAKVVLLPPHLLDVFFYHLTPAVEWYQQGRIPLTIDTPAAHMNGVPLGMTVLSYWFFIFFRDDFLVQLPMLLWALMLVPLSYTILRRSDVGPAWSLKFAILIFFIPIVLMQAVTCKDQLGLNIGFIAGLLFLAEYLRNGSRGLLFIAAVAFGLMLGYKQAAPVYLVVAIALFVPLVYRNRRTLLDMPCQHQSLLRNSALAAATILLLGGYWYLKRGLGAWLTLPPPRALDGAAAGANQVRFSLEAVLRNIENFLPRVFDYQYHYYGADLVNMSGFGPQFAAFGLPALLLALGALCKKRSYERPHFIIVAAAILLLLLFFLPHYSTAANSYRILSFLPMVMIAYGGIWLHRARLLENRPLVLGINLIMMISILWSAGFILPPKYSNPLLLKEYLSSAADMRTSGSYTRWFVVHRPSLYRLLNNLPPTEPVAILWQPRFADFFKRGPQKTWSYPYYDRHWQRRLHYLYKEDYLECRDNRVCMPTPQLKQALRTRHLALVSVCPANHCAAIRDPDFIELTPGFYYFRTRETGQ